MKFVAVIVAVLYIISAVFIALSAFLVSNIIGLFTCGILLYDTNHCFIS